MRINKCLVCVLLLTTHFFHAQVAQKTVPLKDIMIAIEKKFDVKFSYSVDDVTKVAIEKPSESLSLDATIDYLNAKTLLNFKALDDRYVTVSVINKTIAVCGNIYASDDGMPLSGATITIKETVATIIADQKGTFKSNSVPLNATLIISFLGYQSQEIKANDLFSATNNCNTIILKIKEEALNQVLINVFFTAGLQRYIDGSTVLNTKKFGILPGLTEPDILKTIQVLPGVESTNESVSNINVRGGTNDQNLIIWDNIKMYNSGHFFGLISTYNPYLTDKVTVSKNGTSAAYSDGVSSTINMQTKDELKNVFSGGAGINLINADAFLEIPITKKLGLVVSGRRAITDIFKSPAYTKYFERSFQDTDINTDNETMNTESDFYFYDFTAKVLFDWNDKHTFRASLININNELDYAENSKTNASNTESKESSLVQKNLGFSGNWNAQWNSKFQTQFSAYYSKYNINSVDYRVETNQRLREANEVLENGAKFNAFYNVNDNLKLLAGYQFNETGMLNQTLVNDPFYEKTKKDVLLNHALYQEAEFNKNNTYLRLGLRFNYFQKFDKLLIEPRINIRQKLSSRIALKLEGEFKNQTSTQIVDFEDDFLGVEKRRWVLVNNKDIPIAISKQISLGADYNLKNLNCDITAYYKQVNGITASNQGFYNNFQFTTANGSYTAKGIEFLVNNTTTKYNAWLCYALSKNDYEFTAFSPSRFPNNTDVRNSFSLGFNYNITSKIKTSIGTIFKNGQPYSKPVAGMETVQRGNNIVVNYDPPNSNNLDNFFRIDAAVSYNSKLTATTNASLRIGVINATNQKNTINRYYKVDPNDTSKTIQVDNQALELTTNISLRIDF